MRERLIELIRGARKTTKGANCDLEREGLFADYLLANGVIVPPCKVGDTVWFIRNNTILPTMAKWIETNTYGWCVCCEYPPMSTFSFRFDDFGKTVFITREEAEQALRGGEKE